MEETKAKESGKATGAIWAAGVAAISALLFFTGLGEYAHPGESAHLTALWKGLDVASWNEFPFAGAVARFFGVSQAFPPLCGIAATLLLYVVVSRFLRFRARAWLGKDEATTASRMGGAAAALAFASAPAILDAATRLEPRLFDAVCALAAIAVFIPAGSLPKHCAWLLPAVSGALCAAGFADTPFVLAAVPFCISLSWLASTARDGKGYGYALLYLVAFFGVLFAWGVPAIGDFGKYAESVKDFFKLLAFEGGWYPVPLFAIVPFAVSIFSSAKAFRAERTLADLLFHCMLTVVAILATATALSPSSALAATGTATVFSTLAASATAGYALAYWRAIAKGAPAKEGGSKPSGSRKLAAAARYCSFAAGGLLAAVLVFTAAIDRLALFDAGRGAFADEIAARAVADLGGRTWLVTDGSLDDHLRLAAAKAGKELHLVCLTRERDDKYIEALAATVEKTGIGGKENAELVDLLRKYNGKGLDRQRLVPFIQKWFASDPGVAKTAAVYGAPDMWLYAGVEPVPEQFFFGGDRSRDCDWSKWPELDALLAAPYKNWGSHSLYDRRTRGSYSLVEREKLNLRRHMGLLATDKGYSFQEKGRKLQNTGAEAEAQNLYDRAFDMYELVLGNIDTDNVSALFNELELANAKHAKAGAKLKSLHARLDKIKEDENRRYSSLGNVALLYGYICNPEIILKYGISLLKNTGRRGEGLNQIRRALEFVPAEQRANAELTLLAAYYAGGGEADKAKARKMYDEALSKDGANKTALFGLARLAMLDGDTAGAAAYLEKALAGDAKNAPELQLQLAQLHLLKNEVQEAKEIVLKATDADHANVEAWSMLAAIDMRLVDALGAVKEGSPEAAEKKRLEEEIDTLVIPALEKHATGPNDFRLQSTKALVLMHRGGQENALAARDAFLVAAKARPDVAATSDLILGLDIQLNDTQDAERQAQEAITRNREDQMANYVLGSLALQKGNAAAAETYLRIAVAGKREMPLALNDLAETLRRGGKHEEAEKFARRAVAAAPGLYVAWETLGSILLDAGKGFEEAEACIQKACDLSKDASGKYADVRMVMALARVQARNGKLIKAKSNLGIVRKRINELSEYEKREFEELMKSAK